jgi:hypothetical protein
MARQLQTPPAQDRQAGKRRRAVEDPGKTQTRPVFALFASRKRHMQRGEFVSGMSGDMKN